jgi:hypothetical protein
MKDRIDYVVVISQIEELLAKARSAIAHEINTAHVKAYWEIEPIILKYEQKGNIKAEYGKRLLPEISKRLTRELGPGFSRSNHQNMRNFYLEHPICRTLSGKLSCSHYCELLIVPDKDKRRFYKRECASIQHGRFVNSSRQVETTLFEWLLFQRQTLIP